MSSVPASQPNSFLAGAAGPATQAQLAMTPPVVAAAEMLKIPPIPERHTQFQSYARTIMEPSSLAFEESMSPTDLLTKALAGTAALSPRQESQLQQVARGLGFPNAQTLTHALRYLAPESLQQWQANLPPHTPSVQQCSAAFQQAEQALSDLAHTQIETLFSELDLPAPTFIVEGSSHWTASAYLAVFNNFKTMQAELPPAVLQAVGASETQQALEFVRRDHPRALNNPASFMEVLSNSMKIAHTDANNKIYLYDAAVSMDPQDILNSPDLQDYVAQINGKPPSEAHVRSLQDMLNASLPASKQIEVNGQMSARTWAALSDFDTDQLLRSAADIVRDDTQLPAADRLHLQTKMDHLKRQIASPGSDQEPDSIQLMDQLLEDLATNKNLSQVGHRRVNVLSQNYQQGSCANYLKQEQVERLLSNWLGIMDGGDQLDFTEQVINHELGHIFQDRWLADWSKISFQDFEQTPQASREFMQATLQAQQADSHAAQQRSGFGSDYARVNPAEDFAESFRLFTRHPEQLLEQNLLKFMFMAGATGAYADRESELIDLAKGHGYTDAELQETTRTLRGQSQEYHVEAADRMLEKGLGWFNETWMATGLRHLGYEQGQDVRRDLVETVASRAARRHLPQFNLKSAALLPGLEGSLNMSQTASRAILPAQEGYLMSWLEDQATKLYAPTATSAERETAQQNLERFWTEGADALGAGTHTRLTDSQQERAANPESRAIMLSLAHFDSMGQALRSQTGPLHSEQAQASLSDLKAVLAEISDPETMVAALRETIGESAFNHLPKSFLSYLNEPGTLAQVTGQRGHASVGSQVSLRSAEQEVNQRERQFQSAMQELTNRSSNLMFLLSNMAFHENAQGQTVVNPNDKETVLVALRGLFQHLSAGRSELNTMPGMNGLEQILETMAQNIQSAKSVQRGPVSLEEPKMLENIQNTLIRSLLELNQVEVGLNAPLSILEDLDSGS